MSSTTQSTDGVATAFVERLVQVDSVGIRYLEAGQGSPVVILHGAEGLTQSPLHRLLAQHFRVIALEIPAFDRSPVDGRSSSMRNVARTLARAAAAVGVDHYVLVSIAASAPIALWQAIEATEGVDALILISPTASGFTSDPELERRLGEMQVPTLILIGTNDTTIPPETGRLYVERLPNCYYTLVYDAGQAIAAERPEALLAAVCDFVERRGAFIVERNSTAVNP
jgi:pimeloyl-ACP methyl ester carboxylesterase